MDILVDTAVLLRLTIRSDPAHAEARRATRLLKSRGENLVALTQNAAEFWNVCTRPIAIRGGYDLPIDETARKLRLVERLIEIRADSRRTFEEWKRLVVHHSVRGVQVHDARLVAAMNIFSITHLLTFNAADFKRYPWLTVLAPANVK
jgi:predicted nucleic acid-binding protein